MGYIKPKKRKGRLQGRIEAYLNDKTIQNANQRSPGTYTKPGSMRK